MKFILNKDTLEIENIELVNSGSISYYEADVEYDESWNDLVIEAVMLKKDEDAGKSIAVINNKMYIDQKLRGTYCIGFVGYKIEEEKKIYQVSTNLEKVYFDLGAGEIETENVEVLTLTEWEIYIAEIQKIFGDIQILTNGLNEKVVEVEEKLANGDFTPDRGVDYWTEEDQKQIKSDVMAEVQPQINEIEDIAEHAEVIAKGKATGYVFDTLEDLDLWLQDETNTSKLVLGDNLYIRALGVPDYWWDGSTKQPLETQKVDLTEYAKEEYVDEELAKKINAAEVEEKELLITYEDTTTETVKLVVYK